MTHRTYLPKRPAFPNELRSLFEQLAAWAVASSFGAVAAGCSANRPVEAGNHAELTATPAPPAAPAPPADWQRLVCGSDGGYTLERVALASPVDSIAALRTSAALDHDAIYVSTIAAQGTPCASASDKAACDAQVKKLTTPPAECGCGPSVLVTDKHGARRITELPDYLALAGSIDTSAEAVLGAFLAGQHAECAYEPDGLAGREHGTRVRETADGYEVFSEWERCSDGVFRQTTSVSNGAVRAGEAEKIDESHCVIGRRPEGLAFAAPLCARTALGEYFACAARLEAASVFAFERLIRELRALSAPEDLVQLCARAAVDEIEHTKLTRALARRFGAEPALPAAPELPVREPLAIALENAVEGCVRETYGAMLGYCQAAGASDPAIRAAMTAIARDEVRHAELAWAIARWLEPQLSHDGRAVIAAARRSAVAQLASAPDLELGAAEQSAIGWPSRDVQAALLARLSGTLEHGDLA